MTLLQFPQFVASELGLRNVEVWNLHFQETTAEYCAALRAAAERAGTRIVNLQLDLFEFDLSSPNPTARAEALAVTKDWMRRAATCGAPSLRANTSMRRTSVEEQTFAVDSFRELAAFGREIGVVILVENHAGSTLIDDAVAIVDAVKDSNCKLLLDWGNSPGGGSTAERIRDFSKMFPKLALVSAKGLTFDADYRHLDYDVAEITRAVEASGFCGLYSIELYVDKNPPLDPAQAVRSMVRAIAPEIVNESCRGSA